MVHLHRRGKWKSQQSNISPRDIVLLKDDDTFSRAWPLGRVLKVYPGPDGLVKTVDLLLHGKTYRLPISKLVYLHRENP